MLSAMRERRRTLIAALALAAVLWLDRPAPLVSVAADLDGRVPATARAALDLGLLGTVALTWTVQRLR